MGLFDRLKQGLDKTRKNVSGQIENLFKGLRRVDESFYEDMEEALILSDLGVEASMKAVEQLRVRVKKETLRDVDELKQALKEILIEMLGETGELKLTTRPSVVLVIGVNGVGKTTTIGKLAHKYKESGKKVLICAADTFRAAAADQLEIWANRAKVDIVRQNEGADPASVVFDAIAAGKARHSDVIFIDTAGRLHNKQNLMNELGKIVRIIERELPGADRETLLVLDGTTGQNALFQAKEFKDTANVTGLVLTKLDGTAKGGVVVAIAEALGLPVRFVGVGEGIDDLMPFDPVEFVNAIIV